jgi:hypothetical protein
MVNAPATMAHRTDAEDGGRLRPPHSSSLSRSVQSLRIPRDSARSAFPERGRLSRADARDAAEIRRESTANVDDWRSVRCGT